MTKQGEMLKLAQRIERQYLGCAPIQVTRILVGMIAVLADEVGRLQRPEWASSIKRFQAHQEERLRDLSSDPDNFKFAEAFTDDMHAVISYLCNFESITNGYGMKCDILEVIEEFQKILAGSFEKLTGQKYVPLAHRRNGISAKHDEVRKLAARCEIKGQDDDINKLLDLCQQYGVTRNAIDAAENWVVVSELLIAKMVRHKSGPA